jgi:hypothetical protein
LIRRNNHSINSGASFCSFTRSWFHNRPTSGTKPVGRMTAHSPFSIL